MQKPSTLLVLPVMDFHQRLHVVQSGFKGLGELRVSSILCTSLVVRCASIHTGVQRSLERPGPRNCVTCRRAIQVSQTTSRGHSLGLTDGLRNVHAVLALPQLQQIVSCAALCPVRRDQLVRHPSSNSTLHRGIRFESNSFSLKSLQQTLDPHVITRQVHICTHRCATWQTSWFRQLQLL